MRLVRVSDLPVLPRLLRTSSLSVLEPWNLNRLRTTQPTSPTSTLTAASGPLAWGLRSAPVRAHITNVGFKTFARRGWCDDHDLKTSSGCFCPRCRHVLSEQPTPHRFTFKYTWTSPVPADLDIFAISTKWREPRSGLYR